jgi:hypothetical protein
MGIAGLVVSYAPVHASSTNGFGRITDISGTYNGAILFNVDMGRFNTDTKTKDAMATRDALPACAAAQPNRWAIDASTQAGLAAAQTLLWAKQNNRAIYVTGSGKCSVWSDVETVTRFDVQESY